MRFAFYTKRTRVGDFLVALRFGAAKDFEHFIDAMGAIKMVTLNSRGGRISGKLSGLAI